jgi:hypothetical protein
MSYPPLEGEGRSEAPGWGESLQWITPTRGFAATSPLKGEVAPEPLLPACGEKVPAGG